MLMSLIIHNDYLINILIWSHSQYKNFIFFILSLQNPERFYTSSTSQFIPIPFQMWLVATILDRTALLPLPGSLFMKSKEGGNFCPGSQETLSCNPSSYLLSDFGQVLLSVLWATVSPQVSEARGTRFLGTYPMLELHTSPNICS